MVDRVAPYVVALVGAPLLVIASLLAPANVHSPADARAAAYGYPIHFATSRIDTAPGVVGGASASERSTFYPSWEPFNPWENATSGDSARCAASIAVVAAT